MRSEIMERWMNMVEFKITEGSDFGWDCFGPNAYTLSYWNQDFNGCSFNIIFDTRDHVTYMLEAHDYKNQRAYRWIAPTHQPQHMISAASHEVNEREAWEDVEYVDLEVLDDWFEKATAIYKGEDYDDRVQIPVDFTDAELLKYMTMAHERDMTFNQFIEEALRHSIEEYKRDPEGMKQRAKDFRRGE